MYEATQVAATAVECDFTIKWTNLALDGFVAHNDIADSSRYTIMTALFSTMMLIMAFFSFQLNTHATVSHERENKLVRGERCLVFVHRFLL